MLEVLTSFATIETPAIETEHKNKLIEIEEFLIEAQEELEEILLERAGMQEPRVVDLTERAKSLMREAAYCLESVSYSI